MQIGSFTNHVQNNLKASAGGAYVFETWQIGLKKKFFKIDYFQKKLKDKTLKMPQNIMLTGAVIISKTLTLHCASIGKRTILYNPF